MMERRSGDDMMAIVKGMTYTILPQPADVAQALEEAKRGAPQLGFSGRGFRITFLDGRVVDTNNLWAGPSTPWETAYLFPDNATMEAL